MAPPRKPKGQKAPAPLSPAERQPLEKDLPTLNRQQSMRKSQLELDGPSIGYEISRPEDLRLPQTNRAPAASTGSGSAAKASNFNSIFPSDKPSASGPTSTLTAASTKDATGGKNSGLFGAPPSSCKITFPTIASAPGELTGSLFGSQHAGPSGSKPSPFAPSKDTTLASTSGRYSVMAGGHGPKSNSSEHHLPGIQAASSSGKTKYPSSGYKNTAAMFGGPERAGTGTSLENGLASRHQSPAYAFDSTTTAGMAKNPPATPEQTPGLSGSGLFGQQKKPSSPFTHGLNFGTPSDLKDKRPSLFGSDSTRVSTAPTTADPQSKPRPFGPQHLHSNSLSAKLSFLAKSSFAPTEYVYVRGKPSFSGPSASPDPPVSCPFTPQGDPSTFFGSPNKSDPDAISMLKPRPKSEQTNYTSKGKQPEVSSTATTGYGHVSALSPDKSEKTSGGEGRKDSLRPQSRDEAVLLPSLLDPNTPSNVFPTPSLAETEASRTAPPGVVPELGGRGLGGLFVPISPSVRASQTKSVRRERLAQDAPKCEDGHASPMAGNTEELLRLSQIDSELDKMRAERQPVQPSIHVHEEQSVNKERSTQDKPEREQGDQPLMASNTPEPMRLSQIDRELDKLRDGYQSVQPVHFTPPVTPEVGRHSGPLKVAGPDEIGTFNPGEFDQRLRVVEGSRTEFSDVTLFITRIQEENLARPVDVFKCLRGDALEWYLGELTDIERSLLRHGTAEAWCTSLRKRFGMPSENADKLMGEINFKVEDACSYNFDITDYTSRFARIARNASGTREVVKHLYESFRGAAPVFEILRAPAEGETLAEYIVYLRSMQLRIHEISRNTPGHSCSKVDKAAVSAEKDPQLLTMGESKKMAKESVGEATASSHDVQECRPDSASSEGTAAKANKTAPSGPKADAGEVPWCQPHTQTLHLSPKKPVFGVPTPMTPRVPSLDHVRLNMHSSWAPQYSQAPAGANSPSPFAEIGKEAEREAKTKWWMGRGISGLQHLTSANSFGTAA